MKRTLKQIFSIICLCSTSLAYAQTSHSDSVLQHKACFVAAKLELEGMLQGKVKPSFERAIFLIENAFYGNEFDYAVFQQVLDQQEADIRLMKETKRSLLGEKLIKYDPSIWKRAQQTPEQRSVALENLLANWAIYAYMKDTVILAMKDGLRFIVHQKPYAYSRSDPMGTADWRNTQVTHLIAYKEGNCFALAALYKILAERLETDALLATAPSHIFIRHADEEGRMYNVELSNNSFPGSGTMETLTYTTKEATQNNIAMRNLSQEQSIALCLVYLAKGYEQVFNINSDPIVMNCANTALQYDSLNLNALLLKSEVLQDRLVAQNKSIALLKNEKDFKELELLTSKLYKLGYREMPLGIKNFLIQRWTQDSSAILVSHNYAFQPPTVSGVSPTRYASLSWGLFDEEIPVKDIERYGRFLFDTKSHKLTAIAPEQVLYNHYSFDPVAFAMNVDPMAHKLPGWSPYVFCKSNPILNFDPDGAFPYTFHVRSFAPFKSFGGGFEGDNRGYTTSLGKGEGGNITSRMQHVFTVDPTASTFKAGNAWSDQSSHPLLGKATAKTIANISGFKTVSDKDGNKTSTFTANMKAANPLTEKLGVSTPDIDIHTKFTISENIKKGTLDVNAIQTGDAFPSAETFIGDSKGNQLFIGVSAANGSPYTSLSGDNDRKMMSANFSISIDKEGAFTEVKQGDKTYTPTDWNTKMQSQPTTK